MLAHPPAPPLLSPAMMRSRLLSPANHCRLSPYYCHSSSINSENEHSVLVYVHAVQSVYRGQHQTPSRNRKRDRALQNDYERYIRQRRIPRHSLLYVKRSPWHRVFNSGDPQAMITDLTWSHSCTFVHCFVLSTTITLHSLTRTGTLLRRRLKGVDHV
jgi:hypothetical protein